MTPAASRSRMGPSNGARRRFLRLGGWGLLAPLWLPLGLLGCEEERAVDGPEQVVKKLVEIMQGVHGDRARGEAAVALLWEPARENLSERARRASAASGHPVHPGEMLAPSWFSLQFQPRSWSTRIDGSWAEVIARGDDPSHGQFRIRCVKEDDAWRVALELPPLAPIRKRDAEPEKRP